MSFIERIIKSFAPHLCIVCGVEGNILCDPCRLTCLFTQPSVCFLCNKVTQDFKVCKTCAHKTVLRHMWFSGEYSGVVKDAIRAYKFGPKRAASADLAQLIIHTLPYVRYDFVTFVPTTSKHIRQRGFDHAELLAKDIAQELQLPFRRVLVRTTQAQQVGASRHMRLEQMRAAFRLSVQPHILMHKRILIVDDVVSTGATIMAAASCIKRAGAHEVSAAVIAYNKSV